MHQCAHFSPDPKQPHADAAKWLGRYLKGTKDKGMILKPKGTSFNIYVNSDYAGNWNHSEATYQDTAHSRHGYIILYTGCPILWALQLQTEIALSSTESEFIGLLTASVQQSQSWSWSKSLRDKVSTWYQPSQQFIVNSLRTTAAHLKPPRSQRCAHAPSTSMSRSSITSGTTLRRAKSCCTPSTPMISQQTCSPSH